MFELETVDGFPIVSLCVEVDASNVDALEETLNLLDLESVVIISLERAEFIDATVLAALVREHFKLHGNVVIVLPEGSSLSGLFDEFGVRSALRFVPDRIAAVKVAALLRDVSSASFSRDGASIG